MRTMCGDAGRGEQLVREKLAAGDYPLCDGMVDCVDLVAYFRQERLRVERYGQCKAGCDRTAELPHHVQGYAVCPHTLEPCEKHQLQPVLDLFEKANL